MLTVPLDEVSTDLAAIGGNLACCGWDMGVLVPITLWFLCDAAPANTLGGVGDSSTLGGFGWRAHCVYFVVGWQVLIELLFSPTI